MPYFWEETLFCPRRGSLLGGKQQHSFLMAFLILLVHPLIPLGWLLLEMGLSSAEALWESRESSDISWLLLFSLMLLVV